MFAKSRGSSTAPCDLLPDPIRNTYEIGKQSATAGPENVWRIYDGYRKKDRMEVSIFLFDKRSVEKLTKPKRRETVTDILRAGAAQMERYSHPKLLQVRHAYTLEECADTLAFASEPVLASLANVLAYKEQLANTLAAQSSPMGKQNHPPTTSHHRSTFVKEYELLELEVKYGILQITEALLFLHTNCKLLHRNVCPTSIIITKRGTWKLSGFEFIEGAKEMPITVQSWTKHMPKMTQPNLDYIAPEVQQKKIATFFSDMYSLGMTICAIYNQGRPLIQANHNSSDYLKQLETLDDQVSVLLPLIPIALREAVMRLLHKDPMQRPTAQVLTMIKFFQDPLVHALQFLDVSKMKDVHQKEHFYSTTLRELLPYMPKKLWYQHIWTYLHAELQTQEVLPAVLQPLLYIVQSSTKEEYERIVFPSLKPLFTNRKSIQGTVTMLENLHIILEKTPQEYERDVLSMLYMSFENSTIQVRTAAFVAVAHVTNYLEDDAIRNVVLPKLLEAFENNSANARVLMDVVPCILSRLEKQKIIDCILPLLCKIKLQEPEIVVRVVNIYRLMLTDKKYGLSVNWMATHAMPSLLPQTVNPKLNLDQFILLLEVLQDMLNNIERHQRNKLTLDNLSLPSPDKSRPLRHQYSTDNVHVPAFNIPNLRIEQRKTSSAEDMARKNSIGSIGSTASAENMARKSSVAAMFGGWFNSPSANDSNFLRVANTFTSRRLSDNTLMTPKIKIAPSCASSPGGTPGTGGGGGLPIRRHSSTGPQERRGSNINLSPPTGGGMPITSSSVPYLLSSSLNSIRGSRRPSVSSTSSQQGLGLLQQVGSSMVRQLPPICLNLNGPPPPPTLSPSLQLPGQHSH
ncbi:PREDICTED: SCY1-like protein 2 [Wasmannia auropunctata]|uniref:SCY1-like protein 2 n=1 Tax=Wasmannia auropunctata TaxID=64793 RepID=UPI0005EF857D|nr:PREDICTED: SCY1-like protein 2 [Wasmannia auropunctata]